MTSYENVSGLEALLDPRLEIRKSPQLFMLVHRILLFTLLDDLVSFVST